MHFTSIANILILSSLVCANVMVILWRRRRVRGAKALSLVMLSMFIWGLAEALGMASLSSADKILWAKISYLGVATGAPLLFLFAFQYFTQSQENKLSESALAAEKKAYSRLVPYLWGIPVITILLAWTNDFHHLVWTGYHLTDTGEAEVMIFSRGAWFWVNVTFTYMLLTLSTILLVLTALRLGKNFKQQGWALLLSLPAPILGNLAYLFFRDQLQGIDLTPVGFAITGIILTFGIYNFYLMDLTPFERETLMEYMPEAILVLDHLDRVLDMNSAVNNILGKSQHLEIGDSAGHLLAEWINPDQQRQSTLGQIQVTVELLSGDDEAAFNSPQRFFALCITPVSLHHNQTGRILIFTDITDRIANEDLLSETNEKLNSQLVEIHILKDQIEELAVHDALTGLYNRRFLNETLSREFARAGREHYTISIAMIDVDHFKYYNDSFGHQAGDDVLVRLSRHLVENLRGGDVVVRYGGEEFIVLLPFVNTETAENRIDHLRSSFSQIRHRPDDLHGVTFSAGIASFPQHGSAFDQVLKSADQALYCAKQAGRNQVAIVNLASAQFDVV